MPGERGKGVTLTLPIERTAFLSEPTALALSRLDARQRRTGSIFDPLRQKGLGARDESICPSMGFRVSGFPLPRAATRACPYRGGTEREGDDGFQLGDRNDEGKRAIRIHKEPSKERGVVGVARIAQE